MDNGTDSHGAPFAHDTHADPVLSREHTDGWFAGYQLRAGNPSLAMAWLHGFIAGMEVER